MTGEPTRWIHVCRWEEFQHYKDRDPRWIKSYTRLLGDWNYLRLSLRLRGLLHGIWLLYAASGRELGASPAQLGRMLGDDTVRMRDLESLSHAGFIVLSASKSLAPRYPRSREEADREEDLKKSQNQEPLTLNEEQPPHTRANGHHDDPRHIAHAIAESLALAMTKSPPDQ